MRPMSPRRRRLLVLAVVAAFVAAACGSDDGTEPAATQPTSDGSEQPQARELAGLIRIEPGECADAGVTSGSSFRMVQSGGSLADGPFVPNGDSPCGDQSWTPLAPGADGGLLLGEHQPTPDPAFDANGNAVAGRVTEPATWFAVGFATATNAVDPQTGSEVPAPRLEVDADGAVTGDLSAFAASWNGQHFNQGSPKPDGSMEANTTPVTGSYDEARGRRRVVEPDLGRRVRRLRRRVAPGGRARVAVRRGPRRRTAARRPAARTGSRSAPPPRTSSRARRRRRSATRPPPG